MIKTKLRGHVAAIAFVCLATTTPVAASNITVTSPPVGPATITVTPTTLVAAFNAAHGGDTLKLVGTFSGARLSNAGFSSLVTLDLSGATFTNMLQLTNTSNVKISGGNFDLGGDAAWTRGILISGGRNVYVDRIKVTGSGSQWGVSVIGTGNAQITNGTFSRLNAAILFGSASGGLAAHNTVTNAESDGIDIANSHNVTASYNSCTAGAPGPGVHPDCVQLWSVAGDPLQSDITVSYNQATGPTQGFTSFSEAGGALRLKFLNNVANTSYPQGVACYDCVDSIIANNRLTTLPGSTYQTSLNIVGGSGNTVYGNTVAAYRSSGTMHFLAVADSFTTDADDTETAKDMLTQLILADPGPDIAVAGVPEPASWSLLVVGFAAIGLARRAAVADAAGRSDRRMA